MVASIRSITRSAAFGLSSAMYSQMASRSIRLPGEIHTLSLMLGSAGRALGPEPREYFLAGDRFNPAAFQIVVAPIERFPREAEFLKKLAHHVFHEFVTPASTIPCHLL